MLAQEPLVIFVLTLVPCRFSPVSSTFPLPLLPPAVHHSSPVEELVGAASLPVELEVERGGGALEACSAPRKTTPVGDYVSDPAPLSQHLRGESREVRKPPTQQPMRPRRIRRRMVNPAQPTPRPLTTLGR